MCESVRSVSAAGVWGGVWCGRSVERSVVRQEAGEECGGQECGESVERSVVRGGEECGEECGESVGRSVVRGGAGLFQGSFDRGDNCVLVGRYVPHANYAYYRPVIMRR